MSIPIEKQEEMELWRQFKRMILLQHGDSYYQVSPSG